MVVGVIFSLRNRMRILEVFDRFAMTALVGAAMVRLGNFLNSEIVGRATDVPWAVRFIRYDGGNVARHPSQLYESALGFFVLLVFTLQISRRARKNAPLDLSRD